VVHEAWITGFTTKSDFAREFADFVAMAASMGFITTRINSQVYGKQWQVTSRGLAALEHLYGIKVEEDDTPNE
jgi:hypothetical protein